ncbi:MAG: exodeoxyribonuclease VII small subunit [Bacteroidaceae bacterium]|nr:exodeoxyribonuclease VII small subunit [Bacteroidaceae bacterium]
MKKEKLTYEEAMQQLEALARQAEDDKLPIDQLADKLKEAQQLIDFCKKKLTEAEEQVQQLLQKP